MKFQEKAISNEACRKELARYIFEGKADIHSDPLLYRVCVQDLKHYCSDVPAGHGRRKLTFRFLFNLGLIYNILKINMFLRRAILFASYCGIRQRYFNSRMQNHFV